MLVTTAVMPRTLVVARHFPPSTGGIQTFTEELLRRLDPDRVVVVAPGVGPVPGLDATLPYTVVRLPLPVMLSRSSRVARDHACTAAWIPAAAPYGLLTPGLRRAGVTRIVASTHGQEVAWLRTPPTRSAIQHLGRSVDVLTYLGPDTGDVLRLVVDPSVLRHLPGGVDVCHFPPAALKPNARDRPPHVVTVSRLVPRKGHDVLLRAWSAVLTAVPDARLVVIGDGPLRAALERSSRRRGFGDRVRFTGRLSHHDLVSELHRAHVFVAPCRDRMGRLMIEGLGLAVLEASATGLPVVVGRSGGSPRTVMDGETGLIVDASRADRLAHALVILLRDPAAAVRMGQAGRRWMRSSWSWDASAARLVGFLSGSDD